MSRFRSILASASAIVVGGFSTILLNPMIANAADDAPYYWDVPVPSQAQADIIARAGIEMVPAGPGKVTIAVDEAKAQALRDQGLQPTKKAPVYKATPQELRAPQEGIFYGGYHTSAEMQAHAKDVATKNPGIAASYDIGKTWLAQRGNGGHPMSVICLSGSKQLADKDKATAKTTGKVNGCALSPSLTKPRFLLTAQIHARELATGELAWRWIDYLASGYGKDATATSILDSTEIWVVPVTNPDGVDVVASGGNRPKMQRKNVDNGQTPSSCSIVDGSGNGPGIDLNRNFATRWGGDSRNPCSQTYQGPRAASEPETQAISQLYANLFPNQRPSGGGDVPNTAKGVVIDLHSYGNYGIIPTAATPTNREQLRALIKKVVPAGFTVGTDEETVGYSTWGTTDDQAHGALGVASFTIEIGPNSSSSCAGFMPKYSCVDSLFWPQMKKAWTTAALAAGAPYKQGSSPTS